MLLAILAPVFVLGVLGPTMGVATKQKTRFKNLVTFGDSYTDVVLTRDGGVSWPTAGATCSNKLTFRPFPSLMESQVPALVDTTARAVNWVKTMYDVGARHFLFQNMIPLDLKPLYLPNSYPNRYWALERNTTEWSIFVSELTRTGNALSRLMLRDLAPQLPCSRIGLSDSHALFTDMHRHPARYFNGTAPLNVTGSISACVFQANDDMDTASYSTATGTDADNFLWFDQLHPSEQADRMVAEAVAAAMKGSTRWTTWLG
ncbi:hypothetical protein AURDEDRAFT_199615 [Auricularia subglabra TFB-10046 SS5]|nr:hypothetical protein AURDEDRAFT_199615 [Auricularia subglabra TFB-10046 SS5]